MVCLSIVHAVYGSSRDLGFRVYGLRFRVAWGLEVGWVRVSGSEGL